MSEWLWVLVGAVLSGPLWVGAVLWSARRIWRNARRLSARAKGHEHLVQLGHLVGGLAHEIKNPLSTIDLNLKLLAEDIERYDDETHGRWLRRLESVREETARVEEVLEDFLRFAGNIELTPVVTDIRKLVGELSDFFAPQVERAGVVLRIALPESPVRCSVDAKLFKQALLNLLINALQAMTEGGELLVKVAARRNQAVVEVIDTGGGMEPEDLAKIFGVYYSTKQHGTGLGLPMTRRIIREHEGAIRVESEPGKGTRFIVTLPLAK